MTKPFVFKKNLVARKSFCHTYALVLSSFLAIFAFQKCNSATCIWTGTQNNLWSNSANWTNGITPDTGDSLVFPDGPKYRNLQNDRLDILSVSNIIFNGRGYTLGGNKIDLTGDIVSVPSLSTNRVLFPIDVYGPATFQNQGYFNQLELGGEINLNSDPITLETISDIKISGTIRGTIGVGTILHSNSNGRFTLAEDGRMYGDITVAHGNLILSYTLSHGFIDGARGTRLIIGNDVDSPMSAKVQTQRSNLITTKVEVIVNGSGVFDMVAPDYPERMEQTIGGIAGTGLINLGDGKLILGSTLSEAFSGVINGSGDIQIGLPAPLGATSKINGSLVVAGDLTFDGPVNVVSGYLSLANGSLSNSVVTMESGGHLDGSGSIKSLSSDGAEITPGPGTLRVLNDCNLDFWTLLWAHLDGPKKGVLHAGTLNLNSAYLGAIYEGVATESSFTVASTDSGLSANFRLDTVILPEGGWLVRGDPPTEFQITYGANAGHEVVLTRYGEFSAPTLSVRQLSTTECIIEWPLEAHDFFLQHTNPEYLGGWTTNGLPAPATNATVHFVIESNTTPWRLYRLTRPVSPFQ
ncbi:hypothetical protein GC207_06140 [bacterium]|nr:hypothetical protein [bacterium]